MSNSPTSRANSNWLSRNDVWLSSCGSEYLFGQVAAVYASRLPHRAVLSDDFLNNGLNTPLSTTPDTSVQSNKDHNLVLTLFTSSQLKNLLKLVSLKLHSRGQTVSKVPVFR